MYAPHGIVLSARRKARVEIIPLIDVVFFLLATFVLFTLSLNKVRSVPVVLPEARGSAEPGPELVSLSVSSGGVVYWNTEKLDVAEIPARLEMLKKQNTEPRIFVSGDERASLGAVVAVFDQVRQAGITRLSIETRLKTASR